ncbi:hypothetical protein Tco_0056703, partial [Tanacetum coccineum]
EKVENMDFVLLVENVLTAHKSLQKVMRDDDGVFFFKFTSLTGLEQVLEKGPWMIRTDKSKITRKQSKNEQARTRESEEYKAKARKVKPQSNPVKEKSIIGQQKSTSTTIFHFSPQSFTKVQK